MQACLARWHSVRCQMVVQSCAYLAILLLVIPYSCWVISILLICCLVQYYVSVYVTVVYVFATAYSTYHKT